MVSVCSHLQGGCPISGLDRGYPIPGPDGGYPIPGPDRGGTVPHSTDGGYPIQYQDRGVPWGTLIHDLMGYPHPDLGWGYPGVLPCPRLDGVPPSPSAKRALITTQSVCLLHSRRRTFLSERFLCEDPKRFCLMFY